MYVCIYVCMCVCMYVSMYICMYVCMSVCVYMYLVRTYMYGTMPLPPNRTVAIAPTAPQLQHSCHTQILFATVSLNISLLPPQLS